MALLQPGSREWAGSREAPPSENSRMLYGGGGAECSNSGAYSGWFTFRQGSHSGSDFLTAFRGVKHIPSTAILCSAQPHGCPSLDFLPVCPQTQSRACLVPEKEGGHRKKLCFILALESTTRLDWPLNRDGNDGARLRPTTSALGKGKEQDR